MEHVGLEAVDAVEHAFAEVARGDVVDAGVAVDQTRRAVGTEVLPAGRVLERVGALARQLLDLLLVGERVATLAARGHADEVLRAHHRTHAGTSGEVVQVVGEVGEAHPAAPRRSALDDLHAGVVEFRAESLLCLPGLEPGEVRGRADIDRVVVDPQVHGRLRPAVHDQGVETRVLELRAEVPAALRVADQAALGRLGAHVEARQTRDRRSGHHARRDDEHVLRPQRVGADGHVTQQVVRGQGAAAQVGQEELLPGLFDADLAGGQVDVRDPVVVALRHARTLSRLSGRSTRRTRRGAA